MFLCSLCITLSVVLHILISLQSCICLHLLVSLSVTLMGHSPYAVADGPGRVRLLNLFDALLILSIILCILIIHKKTKISYVGRFPSCCIPDNAVLVVH